VVKFYNGDVVQAVTFAYLSYWGVSCQFKSERWNKK